MSVYKENFSISSLEMIPNLGLKVYEPHFYFILFVVVVSQDYLHKCCHLVWQRNGSPTWHLRERYSLHATSVKLLPAQTRSHANC